MDGTAQTLDRVLPFVGIHNFRDYGGYAVAGCGRLRRGQLYRSGHHHHATPEDLTTIATLGLASVIDLRNARERIKAPILHIPGWSARSIFIDEDSTGLARHIEAARMGDGDVRQAMIAGYAGMPFRPLPMRLIAAYFEALDTIDGPSLIHCAAGKDRTGLSVALFHHAMGVSEADMLADYLLTNAAWDASARQAAGAQMVRNSFGADLDDAAVRIVMGVEAIYLETAFAAIRDRYGNLDAYLRDAVSVSDDRIGRIKARYIVDGGNGD